MKKYFLPLAFFLAMISVASYTWAAPAIDANTDLASGKNVFGTFINMGAATDGKVKGAFAQSGDTTDSPQYLNIDLSKAQYLDRVKIFWDSKAYANGFNVRSSADGKYWYDEALGLNAATGVADPASGTIAMTVSLKRAINNSRYIQIEVPASSKLTSPGNYVRIAEVQVFPSIGQKLAIVSASDYAITEKDCVVMYMTSIGAASGGVNYGTSPSKLDMVVGNSESGVDNSVLLTGLSPNTRYYYQVRATDSYGNTAVSKVGNFLTPADNIAVKKKVTGTFSFLPDDKLVKPGTEDDVLGRITDGKTNYFTSMASSGPVIDSDQFVVIDLGKSFKIKTIVSYWRRLAYPESLTVQVSDNNRDWVTVADNVNAGAGGFARSDAGDPMEIVNTEGAPGRYIKLLVKKGSPIYTKHSNWNFVQLMEVKAFAE